MEANSLIDYLSHSLLSIIACITLRLVFRKTPVSYLYISATIIAGIFVGYIVAFRIGYWDPFFPVFFIISGPFSIISAWIVDVFGSLIFSQHKIRELDWKRVQLLGSLKYFCFLVAGMFVIAIPYALISAYWDSL